MKQNQNNIDCAPTKQEEGVAKCLIQMCKDSNAGITSFSMSCEDGYEVTISARKKGKRGAQVRPTTTSDLEDYLMVPYGKVCHINSFHKTFGFKMFVIA